MARPCPCAWKSVYVRCHVECGAFSHYIYTNRRKWIRDAKFGKNNRFEIENETRWSSTNPKIDRDLNSAKVHLWSKFWNPDYDPWWRMARTNSQAQTGVNFDFEVKFNLEGQGQSTPKTIGILTKVFYTYGPNLVILAWTGNELSRGQTWWRTDGLTNVLTDGRTDAGNDNTRWPKLASGKKWMLSSAYEIQYQWRSSN